MLYRVQLAWKEFEHTMLVVIYSFLAGSYVLYSSCTTNRFSNSVPRGGESCSVKPNAVSLKTCHGRYHKLDMITNWTTPNLFFSI
jgi:hypothetical protein